MNWNVVCGELEERYREPHRSAHKKCLDRCKVTYPYTHFKLVGIKALQKSPQDGVEEGCDQSFEHGDQSGSVGNCAQQELRVLISTERNKQSLSVVVPL